MKTWLKTLIAAVIGGGASAGLMAVVDPATVKLEDLPSILRAAAVGAVIAVFAYLKQSPLPPEPKI